MDETPKWEVNLKSASVKMLDGSLITGVINIRDFGRLSDFVKKSQDNFLLVVSADDQPKKTFILNKNYIVWIETED
jgi:hypothetical protein